MEDGYIKYQCYWQTAAPFSDQELSDLNYWRQKLYQLQLIGQDCQGIGYGNLSQRYLVPSQFLISGTQTGGLDFLTACHYTLVTEFDLDLQSLSCVGPIQASSEALTHGALYRANPAIQAVIHVHHPLLWRQLIDKLPTTPNHQAYGTADLAQSIASYSQKTNNLVVMGGHENGLVSFGATIVEAGEILLKYYNAINVDSPGECF